MARNTIPEYSIWKGIRYRCNCPTFRQYSDYGGRGIIVCERWNDFSAFLEDMGQRPSSRHTIERVDNDGNYEPSNCVWATRTKQNNNRRKPKFLRMIRKTNDPMRYIHRKSTNCNELRIALRHGVMYSKASSNLEELLDLRADIEMERYMFHTLLEQPPAP